MVRRYPLLPILTSMVVVAAAAGCHHDAGSTSLSSASATAPAPVLLVADADIMKAVQHDFLDDAALRADHVKVAVSAGICTLSGTTDNLLAKERAVRVTETLRGVRGVIDQIAVTPASRTDAQLVSDVKAQLERDPATRQRAIVTTAKDGKVTLEGTAASWPEKNLVSDLAKTVRGVKAIDNQINVKYAAIPSRAMVTSAVQHRLADDVWLDRDSLEVTLDGSIARLKGTVGSVAERSRARNDAWMAGVDAVDDTGIVVDPAKRDTLRRPNDYAYRSDDQIASAVRDAFRLDPRLSPLEPSVAVHGGVASLTGSVGSAQAKLAATQDARNALGVASVKDEVSVTAPAKATDGDIEKSVKRAFSEDLLLPDASSIKASSAKGKVTLEGTLKSGFERFDAVMDAASIPGVVEVVDTMKVDRTPADLKAGVSDRIFWDARVERNRVNVAVAPDGVVTLSGTLDSRSEMRAAVDDATDSGAMKVVDLLQIVPRSDR